MLVIRLNNYQQLVYKPLQIYNEYKFKNNLIYTNNMAKYTESKITRMGSHRWDYWKICKRKTNGVNGFEIHWSDDGESITDHVYTEEDANLIAAAPLMFETLKYLQAIGGLGLQNHQYIQKAIDVAEGRI